MRKRQSSQSLATWWTLQLTLRATISTQKVRCAWVMEDWSCSYDAVFLSFLSIYERSSADWRNDWIRHSRDWNTPLGNDFDHLIILTGTPVGTCDHAEWFSRYCDRFCDQLSQKIRCHFHAEGRSQHLPAGSPKSHLVEIPGPTLNKISSVQTVRDHLR